MWFWRTAQRLQQSQPFEDNIWPVSYCTTVHPNIDTGRCNPAPAETRNFRGRFDERLIRHTGDVGTSHGNHILSDQGPEFRPILSHCDVRRIDRISAQKLVGQDDNVTLRKSAQYVL